MVGYVVRMLLVLRHKTVCFRALGSDNYLSEHPFRLIRTLFNNSVGRPIAIRATTLWNPWDASPPTLEIMETKCIWSPNFVTGCYFFRCGKLTVLLRTCYS